MSRRPRRVLALTVLALLAFPVGTPCQAGEESRPRLSLGYSLAAFPDLDARDATAAMRVYVRELADEYGFRSEVHLYETIQDMANDFRAKRLDFAALPSPDFLRLRGELDVDVATTNLRGGTLSVRYAIVSRTESPGLAALRGRRLALVRSDELGRLYLATALMREHLPEVEKFFGSVDFKHKSSQAVLAVFFGQADACVTTLTSLRIAAELNPQMAVRLRPLISSGNLVDTVHFFRRDYDERNRRYVVERSQTLQQSPRGRQILLLFKIDGVAPLGEHDLQGVKALMAEYDRYRRQ